MKNRLFATVVGLFVIFSTYAVSADDITMVSYEQGWLDSKGTLALKNNTKEEIRNVVFQITYLDMSGNPLDYEEFNEKVVIAPGMTKKLDIKAYEHGRNYHYYKSKNMPGGSPAFKVKFLLKDYNVEKEAINSISIFGENDEKSDGVEAMSLILAIVIVLIVLGATIGAYVLVAIMAKERNRSVGGWILLSLLATPILMIIILLVVGKNEEY